MEVKNAIRLKAFRAEITAAEVNRSIAAFEQDIATGRWQRPAHTAATIEPTRALAAETLTLERTLKGECRMQNVECRVILPAAATA